MQCPYSSMLCPNIYGVSWSGLKNRALSIICPILSYNETRKETGISTIISYCEEICDKVFNAALSNKNNKINRLLTEASKAPYSLRYQGHFALPKWKTDRFRNTFVLSSCLNYNYLQLASCTIDLRRTRTRAFFSQLHGPLISVCG